MRSLRDRATRSSLTHLLVMNSATRYNARADITTVGVTMGDHFYTVDLAERDRALTVGGYHWERIACYVVSPNIPPPVAPTLLPLFRLFNSGTGNHFYTTDAAERDHAVAHAGYREERIACYVFTPALPPPISPNLTPFLRLFNGDAHDHFYTTDPNEAARANDYHPEGSVGLVLILPRPGEPDVPLYRVYKPSHGFWDDVSDVVSSVVDAVVGAVTTVVTAIVDTVDSIIGGILDAIATALNLIFSIPYFGPLLHWVWNIVTTVIWGLVSIIDVLGALIGVMPEKRMRLMVIIQRNEEGGQVATQNEVLPAIQRAIDTFMAQAHVRILPTGQFKYASAFDDFPKASPDYVFIEVASSSTETLDVNCGTGLAGDDLSSSGTSFNQKLVLDMFWGNARRLIGYGGPIGAFAVRRFKTDNVGCSLGPLTDYVLVKFDENDLRTLPHELGHACYLWHYDDPNNLMTQGRAGGIGYSLTWLQKALVRVSRHVTYF